MADIEADSAAGGTGAEERLRPRRWLRIGEHPAVRAAVPLALMALAIFVLHGLLREVSGAELRADLLGADPAELAYWFGHQPACTIVRQGRIHVDGAQA